MTALDAGDRLSRDEILGRTSIAAVLSQVAGPPRHRAWPCPSPQHAQTGASPPVSIDESRGLWCCHGCGAGGTAIDVLVVAKDMTVAEAFSTLRDQAGLYRVEPVRRPAPRPAPRRPQIIEPAPPANAAQLLAKFCAGRGWRLGVAEQCGLSVVTDQWGRPRVRFAFRRDGRVEWHQDRALGSTGPKFVAPTGQAQAVWAVDLTGAVTTAHEQGLAVVVEGPTDGVALAHCADEGAVPAVFGVPGCGTSTMLVGRLDAALAGLTVAVITDADAPGEAFRSTLRAGLSQAGAVVDVRVPPEAGDVDGWRRMLGCDDAALAAAIAEQVAEAGASGVPL